MGKRLAEKIALRLLVVSMAMLGFADSGAALAQARRLGLVTLAGCPTPERPGMLAALAAKGWVEGKNLIVDCVVGGNRLDKADELAADLVARRPDVLAVTATPLVRAMMAATKTIPIVMYEAADPVREGLVASLSRPGGNVTGFASMGIELFGKRVEALSEMAGRPKRLAVITRLGGDVAYLAAMAQEANATARAVGFEWKEFKAGTTADYEPIFAEIAAGKFDSVYVVPSPLAVLNSRRIAELALRHRLPAASDFENFAADGLLLSLGVDYTVIFENAADYIDRILRGAQPADLPVRQPLAFRLVVNARTASALGLAVPPAILHRADRVID